MHPSVTAVLNATQTSWTTTPSLGSFAAWPDDLVAGTAAATLGPTEHRFHASHQPHAMTTTDSAILTLVLWRGPDLRGLSQLTTPTD